MPKFTSHYFDGEPRRYSVEARDIYDAAEQFVESAHFGLGLCGRVRSSRVVRWRRTNLSDRRYPGGPAGDRPAAEASENQGVVVTDFETRLACALASYEADEPHWGWPTPVDGGEADGFYPAVTPAQLRFWLASEHYGDCLKIAGPCLRCHAETLRHKAAWLAEKLNGVSRALS